MTEKVLVGMSTYQACLATALKLDWSDSKSLIETISSPVEISYVLIIIILLEYLLWFLIIINIKIGGQTTI